MVQNPKPAPDLFLYAAKKMNTHPSECLVIEDSLVGVKAAVQAGMRVWGFMGAPHVGTLNRQKLIEGGSLLLERTVEKCSFNPLN